MVDPPAAAFPSMAAFRPVVAFCQTMQRFVGEEFLRDLTFEFDAVTCGVLPWVFFPKTR
ncbi:hypothetical protein [Sinorhizobium fredii]|uniref:hypothetical protein n=1 Tax=Rhizobium fredii TaxID=380 RepID=UPI0012FD0535|nr:hypothetical protein [Sinorhizobium fredii]